eukprot:TRINITY_DN6599_c0_g1_i2.p1 TRINITY_DN6599_c0_g1~~TRINITY_DN6599_c0_g1_i2.p1  ORF type:complete len:311 (-),score=51.26 TRINITY_DN6599_c0_g1_i2:273-1205(-)
MRARCFRAARRRRPTSTGARRNQRWSRCRHPATPIAICWRRACTIHANAHEKCPDDCKHKYEPETAPPELKNNPLACAFHKRKHMKCELNCEYRGMKLEDIPLPKKKTQNSRKRSGGRGVSNDDGDRDEGYAKRRKAASDDGDRVAPKQKRMKREHPNLTGKSSTDWSGNESSGAFSCSSSDSGSSSPPAFSCASSDPVPTAVPSSAALPSPTWPPFGNKVFNKELRDLLPRRSHHARCPDDGVDFSVLVGVYDHIACARINRASYNIPDDGCFLEEFEAQMLRFDHSPASRLEPLLLALCDDDALAPNS